MESDAHAEYLKRAHTSSVLLVCLWVCEVVQFVSDDHPSRNAVKRRITALQNSHCNNLPALLTQSEFNDARQYRAVLNCD